MVWIEKTYQAPPDFEGTVLGKTLPLLLDEGCDRSPNSQAFNQWTDKGWQPLSNREFQSSIEAVALGLLQLGLEKGDRMALLMHSDVNFCLADIASLLAGFVNVPIDLTQTLEHIIFVIQHSEAKTLIISNQDLLEQIAPYLKDAPSLQHIIIADVSSNWQAEKKSTSPVVQAKNQTTEATPESTCLDIPMILHPAHPDHSHSHLPQGIQVFSLDEIRHQGQGQISEVRSRQLRADLSPQQLATIIYIPDEAGQLQGAMLTHENLSANARASFAHITDLQHGEKERVLSFLPLNHVLARCMIYGHINYGHSIYFSNPNRVMKHLKEIRPTILTTVPLLLEKTYSKILEKGNKLNLLGRILFHWALNLAKRYELGHQPKGLYALMLKLADWLVLSKWRDAFGGQLKYLICGGAALKAEVANALGAAGIVAMHGYGLTQASAVVCFNRGPLNRAGTVGVPIAGIEVAIAEDQEILLRGPYITQGYYKNPTATKALIDDQGWLHTGDLGTFTDEGFLKITGLKKSLFKLSTGKYIAPKPIEQQLKQSPLIAQAAIVGAEQKYCGALIFPDLEALHSYALETGIDLPPDALLKHPCIISLYRALVDAANCHLPYWAAVKRFQLINASLSVENELLKPGGEINRVRINEVFAQEIKTLFKDETRKDESTQGREETEPTPESVCPPPYPYRPAQPTRDRSIPA
ncbi:AMP-dependent synthetase/ligase [Leptothermofonsia sp. ETS-13]|uniref:AMP-dependent synthetase/ligase n=1 Tax=Leptothermofonsia sp. ETS-13 TaxID=3035696 RepID=UPI003BA07742